MLIIIQQQQNIKVPIGIIKIDAMFLISKTSDRSYPIFFLKHKSRVHNSNSFVYITLFGGAEVSYGFDGCGHLRIMVSFCSVIVMYNMCMTCQSIKK